MMCSRNYEQHTNAESVDFATMFNASAYICTHACICGVGISVAASLVLKAEFKQFFPKQPKENCTKQSMKVKFVFSFFEDSHKSLLFLLWMKRKTVRDNVSCWLLANNGEKKRQTKLLLEKIITWIAINVRIHIINEDETRRPCWDTFPSERSSLKFNKQVVGYERVCHN